MIDEKKYKEVLDAGLSLDHYLVLCKVKNGEKLLHTKRVNGFLNLLIKQGYIDDKRNLSDKALGLLDFEPPEKIEVLSEETTVSVNFDSWVKEIHKKCQNQIFELHGSKQVRPKLDNKHYSFLPNFRDLGKCLYRVINLYKLKDYEKIEKALLSYIKKCHEAKNWFPLLQYYIIKNGTSQMVTDMDSLDDNDQESDGYKSKQKFV